MAHLVITPGDPTGIGPEITIKALGRLHELPSVSLTIVGSLRALKTAAHQLGRDLPTGSHLTYHAIEDQEPGQVSYRSIETAVLMIKNKHADALVTGPIAKHNLAKAGYQAYGHTEILEKLTHEHFPGGSGAKAEMLFEYHNLRLLLLTRHIPIKEVPRVLSNVENLKRALTTLAYYLRHNKNIERPRLAVLGLNPHAGEIGGEEEDVILNPLLAYVRSELKVDCDGPLAADGFFRGLSPTKFSYDAIVACYHDQGLIPFKMLAGYSAVNITLGLPFRRTSVSHGTAEDIAGQGIASDESLMAALRAAL